MKRPMMMLMLMMIGLPCFAQPDLATRLKTQIEYLTSPELGGRDAPGPNADKVAQWVAERFKEDGLKTGVGDTNYLGRVKLQTGWLDTSNIFINRDDIVGGGEHHYKYGEYFYFFPKRIHETVVAFLGNQLVDCGYGLSLPDQNRNDFPDSVRGKVAVVLAGADISRDKAGMKASSAFKAAAAERAGATALIICYPDSLLWPPPELKDKISALSKPLIDLENAPGDFPVFYYHGIFRASAQKISCWIRFRDLHPTQASNVVALLPGQTDEWVIVGAHYDHIGEGFPGADDNASGTVGLLELARKWGRSGEVPKRGIIFVSFTCEEDGLLGSQWFAQHLPVPKEKIVAMINLDMIGRDGFASFRESMKPGAVPTKGYAAAYFSAPSPALKDILRSASDGVDLQTTVQPINSFRHFGDGAPFHEAGIPTVHIFSGFEADYHEKSDTPDKIDYEKLGKMIDLTDRAIRGLVETETRPGFDPTIKAEGGGMGY